MLLLVIPYISLSSIVFSLQVVSLSGPRFIVLDLDLLFCSTCSYLTEYIWPQARHIRHSLDISDLRPDISRPTILTYLNQVSFMFDCLFTLSRQLLIGIRAILFRKELNRLEWRCQGLGK
jgi:hypothetical protein